jgi:hypothetical protein
MEQDPYLVRQIMAGRRFERAAVAVLHCPDDQVPPEWATDVVFPVVERLQRRERLEKEADEVRNLRTSGE